MLRWLRQWFDKDEAVREDAPRAAVPAAEAPATPASAASPAAAEAPADKAARATGVSFEQKDDVNANYNDWLFGSQDDFGLDTNPAETQVLEALDKIIKSKQSGADMVRRMPGLIPQLLQSLRSDHFSTAQLSRTISQDVVLVAAVIRLANSATKHSGTAITSVEHAVMVIGQEGLRQLVTSVAFRPIIDLHSGHFTRTLAPRIWDQSERCAVANRTLAEALGIDPFEAFLGGLVQHVGLIVSLRIMDQATKDSSQLGSAMFCASLLRDARILSCSIGREWNFPEAVNLAIAEQASMRKGDVLSPLGQLLALSDYLSKVRILVENARLAEGDTRLFKGLSASALACYRQLDALDEALPAGAVAVAAPTL